MNDAERMKEIKDRLNDMKPSLLVARVWGKEHQAMEYMIERIEALEKELKITDELLADRQRVLDAIPMCRAHGPCVPHALDWIAEQLKAKSDSKS